MPQKRKRKRRFRKRLVILLVLIGLPISVVLVPNGCVKISAWGHMYDTVEAVPARRVGLVLGTSRRISNGQINLFFTYRMNAAAELYHAGKVEHLLLSGANPERYYNEPKEMTRELVRRGVPESAITCDYAGRRTLDSVVRAKQIFGVNEVIIISQRRHVERAVFLAQHNKIDAVGYCAKDLPFWDATRVRMREYLARGKAFLDVYFLNTGPEVMGDPEPIVFSDTPLAE